MTHFTAHQCDQRTQFEKTIHPSTYPRRLPQYGAVKVQTYRLGVHVDYGNFGAPTLAHVTGMRLPLHGWSHLHHLLTELAGLARRTNLRPHDYASVPSYPAGQFTQVVPVERAAEWNSPTGRLAQAVLSGLTCDPESLPERSQEPGLLGMSTGWPRQEAQTAYRAAAFQWLWGLGIMGGVSADRHVYPPGEPARSLGRVGTSQRVTLESDGVLIRFGLNPDQFGLDDQPVLTTRITFPVRHTLIDTAQAMLNRDQHR